MTNGLGMIIDCLVAILLVLRGGPEAVPSQGPTTPSIAVARPDPKAPRVAAAPEAAPLRAPRPAAVSRKPAELEVLVPPGEAELLARYAAAKSSNC